MGVVWLGEWGYGLKGLFWGRDLELGGIWVPVRGTGVHF